MSNKPCIIPNPWQQLKQFTDARIAQGRAGVSLPTRELLAFQLAHARARDAVHTPLNSEALLLELAELARHLPLPKPVLLQSQAQDRQQYLQRPDAGRQLTEQSIQLLIQQSSPKTEAFRLAIAVVDGLSATAIHTNAIPYLQAFLPALTKQCPDWQLMPISLVEQGRVAIGDDIGTALQADLVVVLIGERPGLSSPDSMGIYLTYAPKRGCTDEQRNCISNIRPGGLSYADATSKLGYLLTQAKQLGLSGVNLKERADETRLESSRTDNFLAVPNHNAVQQ